MSSKSSTLNLNLNPILSPWLAFVPQKLGGSLAPPAGLVQSSTRGGFLNLPGYLGHD